MRVIHDNLSATVVRCKHCRSDFIPGADAKLTKDQKIVCPVCGLKTFPFWWSFWRTFDGIMLMVVAGVVGFIVLVAVLDEAIVTDAEKAQQLRHKIEIERMNRYGN